MINTGRYWYIDKKSGRKFCIEPISERNQKLDDVAWKNGGIDGTSVKFHGESHGGSVRPEDSIITEENGFKKIWTLPAGTSPDGFIDDLLKREEV